MPLALSTPIAGPQIASLTIRNVIFDVEGATVTTQYLQLDGAGNAVGGMLATQMTAAAFLTAFGATSGTLKARLYAVLENALGVTGTVS